MPGSHAILSSSAAYRWLNCTASPRLEENVPESTSEYAEEGTLAHAICEAKISARLRGQNDDVILNKLRSSELYREEMEYYTDAYVDYVYGEFLTARKNTSDACLYVEKKLDFSAYIPEGFGTADAVIIADGTLQVCDFKYGKGVLVEADRNPQMMIYGLGALEEWGRFYDIDKVKMTIIQPRLDNIDSYELSVSTLEEWAKNVLAPKAWEAFEGKNVSQVPGDWCRFCKVKSSCRALADKTKEMASADFNMLTDKEKAELFLLLPAVDSFISSLKESMLADALSGHEFEGLKLVEGRSNRIITNETKLGARMVLAGYAENDIYRPRQIQTITALEKLTGKKNFAELSEGLIEKPEGKPTLVSESDKRPAVNLAGRDFKDIVFNSNSNSST